MFKRVLIQYSFDRRSGASFISLMRAANAQTRDVSAISFSGTQHGLNGRRISVRTHRKTKRLFLFRFRVLLLSILCFRASARGLTHRSGVPISTVRRRRVPLHSKPQANDVYASNLPKPNLPIIFVSSRSPKTIHSFNNIFSHSTP